MKICFLLFGLATAICFSKFVCLRFLLLSMVNEKSCSLRIWLINNYYALRYIHPVDNRECPVVLGGDYITTETGTGLVHTAPGHGQEDYVTGLKYGLPILSPVDDSGIFTEEAGQFSGLDVLGEGNTAVVKYLDENLSLVMEESYRKFFQSLIMKFS